MQAMARAGSTISWQLHAETRELETQVLLAHVGEEARSAYYSLIRLIRLRVSGLPMSAPTSQYLCMRCGAKPRWPSRIKVPELGLV